MDNKLHRITPHDRLVFAIREYFRWRGDELRPSEIESLIKFMEDSRENTA
jgi:hypothetical protein